MKLSRRTVIVTWLSALVVGMALHTPIAGAVNTVYKNALIFGNGASNCTGALGKSCTGVPVMYWNSADGQPHVHLANGTEYAIPQTSVALSGGYATTANAGTPLTQRVTLNMSGAGVSCVDNSGSARTDCSFTPLNFFNVKDPKYGCFGDWTHDDTACTQAAVNDAVIAGGTVYLPVPGRYKWTSQINVKSIYPVNIVSDMNAWADQQASSSYVGPGANFGTTTSLIHYEAPAGSHSFHHGGGIVRGIVFHDPTNDGTSYVGNFTLQAALDLYDFDFGTVKDCQFQVLNGGAIRAVNMVMGTVDNITVRFSGTASIPAVSFEPTGGAANTQSTTLSNSHIEANYGTYVKLNSTATQIKMVNLGFEAVPGNTPTMGYAFIDNSSQNLQVSNIHMNRDDVTQFVVQAAATGMQAENIFFLGNNIQTSAVMSINGSAHTVRGVTLRNFSAETTQAINITGANIELSDVNILSSGGIAISGNSYVNVKNVQVYAPTSTAGTAVITSADQFANIEGVTLVNVPANMNGIALSGNSRQSSVVNCEVRDTSGTGIAFLNNDTNGSTVWTANRAFSNTTDWSSLGTNYVAWGNLWNGPNQTQSNSPDGSTAIAAIFDTLSAWSNASARLISARNNHVEKFGVDVNGVALATGVVAKPQAIAAAASITVNPTSGTKVRVNLGATAITTMALSAGLDGENLTVCVAQDGTGGRTIATTWTGARFAGGSYTATATLNKIDCLEFVYDSTAAVWLEMGRAMNL